MSDTDPQYIEDPVYQVSVDSDNNDSHEVVMLIEPSRESISSAPSIGRQP